MSSHWSPFNRLKLINPEYIDSLALRVIRTGIFRKCITLIKNVSH